MAMLASQWARTGSMPKLGFATSRIAFLIGKMERNEKGEALLDLYHKIRGGEFLAADCIYNIPLSRGVLVGHWDIVMNISSKVTAFRFGRGPMPPEQYLHTSIECALDVAALNASGVLCRSSCVTGQYRAASGIIDSARMEEAVQIASHLIDLASHDRPMYSAMCEHCEFNNVCGG